MSHYLFLLASARDEAARSNSGHLARVAAAQLPAGATQTWLELSRFHLEPFVDQRHTVGTYPAPSGDAAALLQATLACTNLVLVAPVYWYSFPSALKLYLDQWSAWLRVPGLEFRAQMSRKTLHLITTSTDRAKAQPMIDSARLCAGFFPMAFGGALWGKGGPPGSVELDAEALQEAARFFGRA